MLPLGIVYFVLAVVGIAASLGTTAIAVAGLVSGHVYFQMDDNPYLQHFVQTAPGLFVFAILGLLLFFVVLHIARGVGRLHARIAEVLLVRL
jgi:succinate dehydrogenase hydrophobic anchor subunit